MVTTASESLHQIDICTDLCCVPVSPFDCESLVCQSVVACASPLNAGRGEAYSTGTHSGTSDQELKARSAIVSVEDEFDTK